MTYPHWSYGFNLPFLKDNKVVAVPTVLLFKDGVLLTQEKGNSSISVDNLKHYLFFKYAKPN